VSGSEGGKRPTRPGRPRRREEPVGIKTVEQALDIVDVLARSERPRSLMELSAQTGMEPSKLHRYLVSLCARGLTRHNESSGLYDLGPQALSLGALALARLDEFAVLRGATDELGQRFGESSFLYVWTQAGPVLVHNYRPLRLRVNLRMGTIAPLVHSATGTVFAAYLPEQMTADLLAHDARAEGLDPVMVAQQMRTSIGPRVREEQVYWSDVTLIPNSAACAAPVFDAQGDLVCVIGASFFQHGQDAPPSAALMRAVRDAARLASKQLGYEARALARSAHARPGTPQA
jgi:DNA-binding IclR family transcriptional regulator